MKYLNQMELKIFLKLNQILYRINQIKVKYMKKKIYLLQFHKDNEITFSDGNIIEIKDNEILHQASTQGGSSGSQIIKRDKNNKDNFIIGLHKAAKKDGDKLEYNLATTFDSILENIKEQINEINCLYMPDNDKKEIYLLHNYNYDINKLGNENIKKIYLEAKNMNKSIFEENIELYINDKKMKFNYKYKFNNSKEIKVKLKFKKILKNMSFMFFNCSSLKSIDLTSFNLSNANKILLLFKGCSSLKSIDLSSIDTRNVNDICSMFFGCSSLKSVDLLSFDTSNVNDMSWLLLEYSSLTNINLSNFITNKVIYMKCMFHACSSLKSLDLLTFDTSNSNDMNCMFSECFSLENIDLSNFVTNKVKDMKGMFYGCSSLKSLDLSSFDTNYIFHIIPSYIFYLINFYYLKK